MNIRRPFHPIGSQALEERLGRRLASHLTDQAERLPHDIAERLRVAREQAVLRARRVEAASAALVVTSPGAAALGAPPPWWVRAASVLPLLLLVAGLMLIAQFYEREEILAAADVDVALLADRVPPAAYSDPGFLEFLKQPEP